MERPRIVKGSVGSKAVSRRIWPSMLLIVLLFALLDMAFSAGPVPNPSGFPSSYHLEGSLVDATVKIFDAESDRGVVPLLQSRRLQDEGQGKVLYDTRFQHILQKTPLQKATKRNAWQRVLLIDSCGNPSPSNGSPPPQCHNLR